MGALLKRLFSPPVFPEDEEKTRLARLLNVILWIVILLVGAFSAFALFITPRAGRLLIELLALGLSVLMLILLRRGAVRTAGLMLSIALWAVVTYGTYQAGGFGGSTMSAYFGIILIAGLMLGTWAAIVLGVLSIVATGLMAYAQSTGLLPPVAEDGILWTLWIEFSTVVVGVVGLLTLVMRSLHEALQHARHNQRVLAEKMAEVQTLAEKAQEANRFKTHLIARVSHELRTPLGAILGMTEMLHYEAYGALQAEQKQITARIIENARYLERIFAALLEESRIELGQIHLVEAYFHPTDLAQHVQLGFADLAHEKLLKLEVSVDPTLPNVMWGAPDSLREILSNLVSNAIKFTNSGGVWVRLLNLGDEHWAIEVTDTGIGIPEEAQERIFEPFRQLDESAARQYGGVGLGLSIVQQLANAMGGHIQLQSRPGNGSTFLVVLPLKTTQPIQEGVV